MNEGSDDFSVDFSVAQHFYEVQFYNTVAGAPNDRRDDAAKIILRAKERARDALVYDPGNPELVRAVLFRTDISTDIANYPDHAARLNLWGEVLRNAPFEPGHWVEALDAAFRPGVEGAVAASAFGVNAIAYSNHKSYYVNRVLSSQAMMYDYIQQNHDRNGGNARKQGEIWTELACPTVRLARVRAEVCESVPQSQGCTIRDQYRDKIVAELFARAEREDTCKFERSAPIRELVFYPQSIDVGAYSHVVAPQTR